MRTLTDRQRAFVECYTATTNANATEAARLAGYRSPRQMGSENLSKPYVAAAIRKATEERSTRLGIESDEILARLAAMLRFDIGVVFDGRGSLLPIREWPEAARLLVQAVKTRELFDDDGKLVGFVRELRIPDRVRCAELLGKFFRLWVDRIEHAGLDGLGERLAQGRRQARLKVADD